ncbi:MAG: molybdate ABC transporter substrate-binding protein [Thermoleophilia bacterium]
MARRRTLALLVALLVATAALAACGGGSGEEARVFAASSLTDVLPRIEPDATYSLAGSDELAAQLRQGAPADVFVSAAPRYVEQLAAEGLVVDARVVATNALVVIVPAANPAGVRAPADLTRAGLRLVIGAEGVPVGDYARDALGALGLEDALANVVSGEESARSVVAKVVLGEADAGIVFRTDAAAAGDDVATVALPAEAQPRIEYVAARVTASDRAAAGRAWLERLASPEGRAALRAAGFGDP